MDPNATLADMLRIALAILAARDAGESDETDTIILDNAERLAEHVQALDGWLKIGGFLPAEWEKARKLCAAHQKVQNTLPPADPWADWGKES